jgi:hypothetical protein
MTEATCLNDRQQGDDIMGRAERTKGHNWERAVARMLRRIFPGARRGYQSRGGGKEMADVVDVGPFHVECKVGRRPNIGAALAQAIDDAPSSLWPVAICKKDRESATATMLLDDWYDLVREWRERGAIK